MPHLASKLPAATAPRLVTDPRLACGYAPVLVQTFVKSERFTETSYQAANWIRVGQTKGRRKLVRSHADALPVKDIDLCPWHRS